MLNDPEGETPPTDVTGQQDPTAGGQPVTPPPSTEGQQPPAPQAPRAFTEAELAAMPVAELTALLKKHPGFGKEIFDQESTNRFVGDRLTRERRAAQAIIDNLQGQYNTRLQELAQAAQQSGQGSQEAVAYRQELQRIQESMEDVQLQQEIGRLDKKYPDFGPNTDTILRVAMVEGMSPEQAYKAWKYEHVSAIDLKEIEKRAVDNYVKGKTTTAQTAPRPEGAGGSAPVEANKHDGEWGTAHERALARIKAADNS